MFDIGFWELAFIGVIALLVVGPERLPAMARTVGLYVGKMRRWLSQVRGDVERELRADEIRQAMRDAERSEGLRNVSDAMKVGDIKDAFRNAGSSLKEAADTARTAAGEAAGKPSSGSEPPATPPPQAGTGAAAGSPAGQGTDTGSGTEGERERGAG